MFSKFESADELSIIGSLPTSKILVAQRSIQKHYSIGNFEVLIIHLTKDCFVLVISFNIYSFQFLIIATKIMFARAVQVVIKLVHCKCIYLFAASYDLLDNSMFSTSDLSEVW